MSKRTQSKLQLFIVTLVNLNTLMDDEFVQFAPSLAELAISLDNMKLTVRAIEAVPGEALHEHDRLPTNLNPYTWTDTVEWDVFPTY